MKHKRPLFILLLMVCSPALALKSDREQPMTIDADEIGMDLKTGGRTFDGNVIAEQGSMRLEADKLVVETEDNELSKATAFGEPAIFRQRPEGKEQDVIGRAQQLEFDQVHDIVTLHQRASLTHGGDSVKGHTITYTLSSEQMNVRGGDTQARPQAVKTDGQEPASMDADEMDLNFSTGQREFRGDVLMEQGTTKLQADKLIAQYKDEELEKATAFGEPAVFRQRPEGKEQDVIGRAQQLEFDQVHDIVTLHQRASLTHGGDSVKGDTITYNLSSELMRVRGGDTQARPRAVKTDGQEPASMDADEMDLNFSTGQREFRGDVLMEQGTTKLQADKLIAQYKDEELEKATAFGEPAVFRERPEGEQLDVVGEALRLELDHANDIVTMYEDASITKGGDKILGEIIVYNIITEEMTVRGGGVLQGAQGDEATQPLERPRIIIQPKPSQPSTE